jgi:RNA polymerase primary sigma factor
MSKSTTLNSNRLNQLLKIAIITGVKAAVQIHINRGDNLDARDSSGLTPLMLSAARNRASICQLLLDSGADWKLTAPSGKTALDIAVAAGADDVIRILNPLSKAIQNLNEKLAKDNSKDHSFTTPLTIVNVNNTEEESTLGLVSTNISTDVENKAFPSKEKIFKEIPIDDLMSTSEVVLGIPPENESVLEFDISAWEAEESSPPPEEDSAVTQTARTIHTEITSYAPIDSSVDWEDIEIYLPEEISRANRKIELEVRERFKLLLLRAIREGSVPLIEVEDLSVDDGAPNLEIRALFSMIINDIGAEIDERFEYSSADENYKVFIDPEQSVEEEILVNLGLNALDNLISNPSEPLRIYQKEFQKQKLISSHEEIALFQAMEDALFNAHEALASWPKGIAAIVRAGQSVKTGVNPLSLLSRRTLEVEPDINILLADDSPIIVDESADEKDDNTEEPQVAQAIRPNEQVFDFLKNLEKLSELSVEFIQKKENLVFVRQILLSLELNQQSLVELIDLKDDADPIVASQYTKAINKYLDARERMVQANLKLVFHLAKKHLYSGELLDDLAQEGNLGLLKAVERFDWRKGYKFSTYATWWIRQSITRYIADKGREIRIPVHVFEKANAVRRRIQAFEKEHGHTPRLKEIAASMDIPTDKVAMYNNLLFEPIYLSDFSEEDLTVLEIESDRTASDPLEILSKSQQASKINEILESLSQKESKLLRLRFGIGINNSCTLEEVGNLYDVTRERIRQIEAKAIRKLNKPSKRDALSLIAFGVPYCDFKENISNNVENIPDVASLDEEGVQ